MFPIRVKPLRRKLYDGPDLEAIPSALLRDPLAGAA
jgi:hypothetical protein